jgi:hypothetical protein
MQIEKPRFSKVMQSFYDIECEDCGNDIYEGDDIESGKAKTISLEELKNG